VKPLPLLLGLLCVTCAIPSSMTMKSMIPVLEEMELSVQSSNDLQTIRDGLPSGMLLIEGILRKLPDNRRARLLAAKLYSGYALAYSETSDEDRAISLYRTARDHGLAIIPNGDIIRDGTFKQAEAAILRIGKKETELLFWTAQAWAGMIRLGLDKPRNLAALARVEAMMHQVMKHDPTYFHGGPTLFLGVLLGIKPPPAGGDLDRGIEIIMDAYELSGNHFLLAEYYRADLIARVPGREEEAKNILSGLLEDDSSHPNELTFLNTVAQRRAEHLLEKIHEEEL